MGWARGAVRAWSRASGAPASAGFSGCPCGALLCLPASSCVHGRCCPAVPELLLALPMCQGAAGIPALLQGHQDRSKPMAVEPAVPGPSHCTSANPLGRSSGVLCCRSAFRLPTRTQMWGHAALFIHCQKYFAQFASMLSSPAKV